MVDHRAVGDRRDRALPRALPDDGPDPRVRGSRSSRSSSAPRSTGRPTSTPGRRRSRSAWQASSRIAIASAATYRGHGHALALGVDPQQLLDEMLGRATGVNGGRAGSMNINSPERPARRLVRDRRRNDRAPPPASVSPSSASAASRSASSATARSTRATSTSASTSARCCDSRSSSSARTTATASTRRSRTSLPARSAAGRRRWRCRPRPIDGMSVVAVRAAAASSGRPRPCRRRPAHSSRRSRTGTSGTPAATPARTGRPESSTRGRSATRSRGCAASSWTPGSIRRSSIEIDTDVQTQLADMERRGLEAPFPEPRPTRGVQRVSQDVLRMPRLSDSMSEATIVGWLKQPGESVPPRRSAGRGRDGQGDRRLRGRVGRAARGDPRARGWSRGARRADRPARRRRRHAAVPRQSLVPRPPSKRRERPSPPPRRLRRSPSRRRARERRRWRAGPRSRSASRSPGSTARARAAASAGWTWCEPDRRRRPRRRRRSTSRGPRRSSRCRRRARRSRAA